VQFDHVLALDPVVAGPAEVRALEFGDHRLVVVPVTVA